MRHKIGLSETSDFTIITYEEYALKRISLIKLQLPEVTEKLITEIMSLCPFWLFVSKTGQISLHLLITVVMCNRDNGPFSKTR